MIKISVDEAYAYDMLAILEIKYKKMNLSLESLNNHYELQETLRKEVGAQRHSEIVLSKEFQRLYDANLKIFERIDEIKEREIHSSDATYIDNMNYERYLAKKTLQEKFFPTQKLTEQKIGYK